MTTAFQRTARAAGVFYLLNIATILVAISLFRHSMFGPALKITSTACSLVVAALLFVLLEPVNRSVSLIAMLFRVVACAVAAVEHGIGSRPLTNIVIVFFGFHFLALGYLFFRSTFLPRLVGVLVAVAGVGAIFFLAAPVASRIFPYFAPIGLLAELSISASLLLASRATAPDPTGSRTGP